GLFVTRIASQYWTVTEQNTQVYSLEGIVLWNRLIWLSIGFLALGLTYTFFKTTTPRTRSRKNKKSKGLSNFQVSQLAIPQVSLQKGGTVNLRRILSLSQLYFKEVIKSIPFIAITLMGLILLITNSIDLSALYGTSTFPTTYLMLGQIQSFTLFFLIIIVFYSGELIWRERDVRINLIYDALPVPNYVGLVAKFLGLLQVYVVLIFTLILTGMAIQTFNGYFKYEIGVYLGWLFTDTFIWLTLFTVLAFFIHILANQKFLGHALIVIFFIATGVLSDFGLEHSMWQFASGSMGSFSDMNRFGHFPTKFSWYQTYWAGFATILFVVGALFSVRGTDTLLKTRAKLAKLRFVRPTLILASMAL
ncbi:MAG: aminopeptidase, partial [Bacteroidota bacterium]